jgi:hypothetical protein
MKLKHALAGLLIAGFVTPCLALDTYYVVRDKSTNKCRVVKEKPTGTDVVVLGAGDTYKTEAEAQEAAKTITDCNKPGG